MTMQLALLEDPVRPVRRPGRGLPPARHWASWDDGPVEHTARIPTRGTVLVVAYDEGWDEPLWGVAYDPDGRVFWAVFDPAAPRVGADGHGEWVPVDGGAR